MGCVKFLLRIVMFVSSGVLSVAGAASLGWGIWMAAYLSTVRTEQNVLGPNGAAAELDRFLSYLLMSAGPALALVGVLGCCGAVKDGRCLRLAFFVAALAAALAQAAGVAFVLGFPWALVELLGPEAAGLIAESKVSILWVVGGVTAVEALSMACSMTLYCIAKRRRQPGV